jgi:hypothetical protein
MSLTLKILHGQPTSPISDGPSAVTPRTGASIVLDISPIVEISDSQDLARIVPSGILSLEVKLLALRATHRQPKPRGMNTLKHGSAYAQN